MQALQDEVAKLEGQRQENARRKHNYVPLIMKLLTTLSSRGKLGPMITAASEAANVAAANEFAKAAADSASAQAEAESS